MSNIFKIIKDDFKKLFSSAISLCVVFGLIAVPTIYSLFNIAGYWDPYQGTSNLEIGIVNDDKGYSSDSLPIDVQFGDAVVDSLNDNTSFKWVYTDFDTAMENLNYGKYYATIVVPEDFSKQLINILNGKDNSANLIYYSNQKFSPITPKLIDTGITTIQQEINKSFSNTIYKAVLKVAIQLTNAADSGTMTQVSNSLIKSFDQASSEIDSLNMQMDTLKVTLNTLNDALDTAKELIPSNNAKVDEFYRKLGDVRAKAAESRAFLDKATNILQQYGVLQNVQQLLTDISNVCNNIEITADNGQKIIDKTGQLESSLGDSIDSLKSFSDSLNNQINAMQNDFGSISQDLQTAKDKVRALSNAKSIDDVKRILGDDAVSFADLLASPVKMDKHELYPIENFGSAISGFFVSLSCWAGCLILCTMLVTKLSRKRQAKMEKRGNYRSWQLYFGRYAIFGTFALLQSTVMCLGCIFYLQIKMANPFLFLVTGWIVAICFSFFIYTLVAAFGSVGKVLAVILLVLQVAASGGTFPIAMMTEIYRYIYPFLPVTYTIKAFNMCMGGFSNIQPYWSYIGIVCISMIGISLIIGLVLRGPIEKLNEWFEDKLHSTKLFAI